MKRVQGIWRLRSIQHSREILGRWLIEHIIVLLSQIKLTAFYIVLRRVYIAILHRNHASLSFSRLKNLWIFWARNFLKQFGQGRIVCLNDLFIESWREFLETTIFWLILVFKEISHIFKRCSSLIYHMLTHFPPEFRSIALLVFFILFILFLDPSYESLYILLVFRLH